MKNIPVVYSRDFVADSISIYDDGKCKHQSVEIRYLNKVEVNQSSLTIEMTQYGADELEAKENLATDFNTIMELFVKKNKERHREELTYEKVKKEMYGRTHAGNDIDYTTETKYDYLIEDDTENKLNLLNQLMLDGDVFEWMKTSYVKVLSYFAYDKIPSTIIYNIMDNVVCNKADDVERVDYALQCFDSWGSPETLSYLENLNLDKVSKWLFSYKEQIIKDIRSTGL